jgi:hypothetical protein
MINKYLAFRKKYNVVRKIGYGGDGYAYIVKVTDS